MNENEEEKEEDIKEKKKMSDYTNVFHPGQPYCMVWKNDIKIKIDENIKIKIVDFGNAC